MRRARLSLFARVARIALALLISPVRAPRLLRRLRLVSKVFKNRNLVPVLYSLVQSHVASLRNQRFEGVPRFLQNAAVSLIYVVKIYVLYLAALYLTLHSAIQLHFAIVPYIVQYNLRRYNSALYNAAR